MVNNMQTLRRKQIVNKIVNTLEVVKEEGLEINNKALLAEIIQNTGVTRRTAREYMEEALIKVNKPELTTWTNAKFS